MGDVFEDVVSDEDFSDVEEKEDEQEENDASLSDDDIARVLGLMGGDADAAPRTKPATSTASPSKAHAVEEATSSTLEPMRVRETVKMVVTAEASARAPDLSDFDRFLADFTRQQTTRPSTEVIVGQNDMLLSSVSVSPVQCMPTRTSIEKQHVAATTLPKWGVFTPDNMPVRRDFKTVRAASSTSKSTPPKKLKVVVPSVAYLRTKNVRQQRTGDSANKELTFRPTINKTYYRQRGMARLRGKTTARFTTRMLQDISEREERQKRREAEKKTHEEREAQCLHQRRHSLVARGSQAILERNGLWAESADDRLQRLLKRSSHQGTSVRDSITPRQRAKMREKEVAKARACESLYRRGLDKLQRVRANAATTPRKSPDRHSSHRSDAIVRERLERDVQMICSGHEANSPRSDCSGGTASHVGDLPVSVSFVEFSCVLLYFGFVPAATSPWEGNKDVSLLWHAWATYAEGHGDTRHVRMSVLKTILETVIVKHHTSTGSIRRESRDDPKARLLEIFRLNYIARKRPRGVAAEPDDARKSRGDKTKARRSSRITYSIHGKAIVPMEAPCDLLEIRHSLALQRVEAMRREKEEEEHAQCTFKPRIVSVGTASESLGSYKFREAPPREPEAFDRLYSDAFERQNNNMAQYFRARQEEDEKCKKEMRVSPTYVNGLTIEERLERLHESLSNNALPVHFHEKIAEMRHAYAAKAEDAREKASRLEPAHVFPRSRDGHTIVVPFKFATQQRAKENRRKSMSTVSRPRRDPRGSNSSTTAILQQMRLRYETGDGDADDGDAADLCIDVHVSPFETYQLCLTRGDDVHEATRVFAEMYGLDSNQQQQLMCHAEAKLEQLVDL